MDRPRDGCGLGHDFTPMRAELDDSGASGLLMTWGLVRPGAAGQAGLPLRRRPSPRSRNSEGKCSGMGYCPASR